MTQGFAAVLLHRVEACSQLPPQCATETALIQFAQHLLPETPPSRQDRPIGNRVFLIGSGMRELRARKVLMNLAGPIIEHPGDVVARLLLLSEHGLANDRVDV